MTTRRDISLNVIADISKYQQQFATIPGYTDKQAAKAASALEKRMSKAAVNTAKAATRAAEKAGRQAARAAESSQKAAIEAGKGLVELAGIPADKFEKFRAVLGGLGTPLGQLAIGATAAALAVGGIAVAFGAVATASVSAVRASDELLTKFEKLSAVEGFDIPEEDVESIRQANAALDSVQSTADRLVVVFASKVAPSVNATAVEVVKLGLAAGDVLDGMGGGAALVGSAFGALARLIVSVMTPAIGKLLQLTDIASKIASAAGLEDLAAKFASVSGAVEEIPLEVLEFGFQGLSIATQDYQARAEELVGVSRELADAERETKKATDASTKSREKAADATKRQAEQIKAVIAAGKARSQQVDKDLALREQNTAIIQKATAVELSEMGKLAQATDADLAKAALIRQQRMENAQNDHFLRLQAETEFQEAQTAIVDHYEQERSRIMEAEGQARFDAARAQEEGQRELRSRFASLAVSSAAQATGQISTILADQGQKKRARQMFKVAKALNVAMVVMETIRAARGALLPPPTGYGAVLGPAAATVIAASGAVQVAAIKAQKAPRFYRGTSMVERADGGAGDAVPAVLHQGEAVLNRRAAQSMGRSQIDALNAGGGERRPTVVAISQFNHRQFRDFYRDDRQLPGSLTRGDRNRSGSRIGRQL
jgi:hypothetical protein